jgi:FeS assembly SUF system regulator
MIRLTKLSDYGIVLLTYFARTGAKQSLTARDLAFASGVPLPTVSKLLKSLQRSGLLSSHRGVKGGYALSRDPALISIADIIRAIEGPIAVTECTGAEKDLCDIELGCPVRSNWQRINAAVSEALGQLTLAEMTKPQPGRSAREQQLVQIGARQA